MSSAIVPRRSLWFWSHLGVCAKLFAALTVMLIIGGGAVGAGTWQYHVGWTYRAKAGFSAPNCLINRANGMTRGIIVNQLDLGVVCLDPTGKRLWSFSLKPRASAAPAVGDVDGDGRDDVVAADEQGSLVVLDGGGRLMWRTQLPGAVRAESCPAIVDLDGDGAVEIVVGDASGTVTCLDHTGRVRWTFQAEGKMGPVLAADVYDTPGKEIIVTSLDAHVYALDAHGRWLWDVFAPNDLFPNSTPVLGDTDGDGHPELYIGGGLNHFYRIDLDTHKISHVENVYLHVNAAIRATDLDGDGKDEVIFGNKGGVIEVYGKTGVHWRYEPREGSVYAAPNLLNVDNDPTLEIIAHGFHRAGLVVLKADGRVLHTEPAAPPTSTPPLVGDLDGDGAAEMVITSVPQGTISWVELGFPFHRSCANRLTFAGNRAHSGAPAPRGSWQRRPAPAVRRPSKPPRASVSGNLSIHGGGNSWRFEIKNPDQARLALLVEVRSSAGAVHRYIRHSRIEHRRVSVRTAVFKPGDYRISQRLIVADTLALVSTRTTPQAYAGLVPEQTDLLNKRVPALAHLLAAWQSTNPRAAAGMKGDLDRIAAQLASVGNRYVHGDRSQVDRIRDVACLRGELQRLEKLVMAGKTLAGQQTFMAWQTCPWAYFDESASLPNGPTCTARLAVELCGGEYESLALNLTNLLDRRLEIRARCLSADRGGTDLVDHICLRRAVTVPTVRRRRVADALPTLDSAGLLPIAAHASQQLWITVRAGDLKPGHYTLRLKLESVEPDPTDIVIPIQICVHDLQLPRPRPLRFVIWSYDGGWLGTDRPEVLADLTSHGANVFFASAPPGRCDASGHLTGKLDFTRHDQQVKRLAAHGLVMFLSPQAALKGRKFLSVSWKAAFVEYLRAWVRHLQHMGLNYDRWALYPYDEPSTPFAATTRNLAQVAKIIRAADPKIQIYADPTCGTTFKSVAMLEGLIDIWCPSEALLDRLPQLLPVMKRDGRQVWYYDAWTRARTLSSLRSYRWRFWHAWNEGLTGVGWWTYATHAPDLWQEPNKTGEFYSTVYDGPNGVVPSKRWEAARDGVEDYELLFLLRKAIADAMARGVPAADLVAAQRLLSRLPKQIEKVLHQLDRHLPLTLDSVPLSAAATQTLNDARKQAITMCIRVRDLRPPPVSR